MKPLTPEELEEQFKDKAFRPVYLFSGPEEYLRRQALSQLKSELLNPETIVFNYSEFSPNTDAIEEVITAANTFPMMSDHRLVFVSDIHAASRDDQAAIVEYASKPRPKTVLVLDSAELDRRRDFYRRMKDVACVVEFPKLKGYGLSRWAERYLKNKGQRISGPSLRRLMDLAGSDLQALINEMDKLLLYCGKEKNIPADVVDKLVSRSRQHGIFELTDAIGRRDQQSALRIIRNLLASGEPPLLIVTMLARHFRQVIIAKELLVKGHQPTEIASAAKVPGFLLEEFIRQVRRIDMMVAQDTYIHLARVDTRLKSSSANPRLILESLIYSF